MRVFSYEKLWCGIRSGVAKKILKSALLWAKNTDFGRYLNSRNRLNTRNHVNWDILIFVPAHFFLFGAANSFVAYWYVLEGVRKVAKSADLIPPTSMHDDGSIIGLKLKSSYWFRRPRARRIQRSNPFWLKPDFWRWNFVSMSKISVFHAVFCLATAEQ